MQVFTKLLHNQNFIHRRAVHSALPFNKDRKE
nr:MAG TPA: hypothetical protein [Caudoviricetes sp.]